jgi:flagellin-specific chaperone FliS
MSSFMIAIPRELTDDLNREKEISGQLIEVYRLIISNLNETIGSKNSVPSSSVHV